MKKQYSIAYISAVIALPIALLFIVPGVAKTNAYQWYDGGAWSEDYTQDEAGSDGEHEEDEDTSGADTADNVSNENDDEGSYDTGTHEQSSEDEGDEWGDHDDDSNTEDDDAYSNDRNDKEWGSYAWGTAHSYSYTHNHYNGCGHEEEEEEEEEEEDHTGCDSWWGCGDHDEDDWCHDNDCSEDHDDDYDWCDDHDCSEPEAPTCPFNAQSGRIIVNFDGTKLISNSVKQTAKESISLPAGSYKVSLSSWDGYSGREDVSQPHEQWKVVMLNGSTELARSGETTDVGDYMREASWNGVVNEKITLTSAGTAVFAEHAYYTDGSPNSVVPICVAFDRIQETSAPVCTLTAEPQTTWWSGDEVVLTWTTENADSVRISGIGYASLDGSESVYPTQDTTYTLIAEGEGGTTVQCTDTVEVNHVVDEEVSCDAFTASNYHIKKGESTILNWSTTGASSVAIDQGVGEGLAGDGTTRVYLYRDTTYTLTARDGDKVDTCAITVSVYEDNDTNEVSCDAFTVSDANISRGDEVTLQWNTSNADEVTIDQGVGTVVEDGTKKVTVNSDTTFTLTAKDGSKTDTCTVNVDVKSSGGGGGGSSSKKPQCEFTISDNAISTGQNVILSWVNKYADRMVLKEGTKTLVDTKKDKDVDEDKDDMTVSPDKSTTYTLEVYNGSKKNTCELSVEVGKKGKVEGISLSQVPYTGFDAGPMLTALFYGAIVLWGLVIGYVLVLKKKSRALSK